MKTLVSFSTQRTHFLLVAIVVLAAIFRLWQLPIVPPSLYWDEVSQGYNAYSVLTTGKDEHGEFLPVARFQAFGDYKAPVNIYLTVPSIAVFGKTEFAVRFPSAFLGILTVLATYFLVSYLFFKDKNKELYGLCAALFLAVSPWHIQLSRAAFEGNVATFFTVLSVLLLFLALRKNPRFFIASSISFVLAFYSFNAHRVFIPLLLLFLAIVYSKELFKYKKYVGMSVLVGAMLLVPFLLYLKTPESTLRFNEVNIFSDSSIVEKSNTLIEKDGNTIFAKIINNRRVLYAREYISNYFDFFNPVYLFIEGDVNPRFSDKFNGQLYFWMLPLLLFGGYGLYRQRAKSGLVIIGWLLLAPLAAATARETPHALRSETFIPLYEVIAAVGAGTIFIFLKEKFRRLLPVFFGASLGILLISVFFFWHNYLIHNPALYSQDWQYGYKQTIKILKTIESKYEQIYFTTQYGRPYIYVAWYGDITPQNFWKDVDMQKDAAGFYNVSRLGKYEFVESLPQKIPTGSLLVMPKEKIPPGARILETITFRNNKPAFVIAEPEL